MIYHLPESLNNAIDLIQVGAVPIAGGTILALEILNFKIKPEKIVDLRNLNEIKGIKIENNYLEIGALTTIEEIANDPLFDSGEFKAFKQAASSIGNPQVRRVGTVGGNLLWNNSGSDLRPVFFCFDGEVSVLIGNSQSEWIPVKDFWASQKVLPYLITKFRFKIKEKRQSGFKKFAWRKSSGKTIVSIALTIDSNNDLFNNVNIFMGGVEITPVNLVKSGKMTSNDFIFSKESFDPGYINQFITAKGSTPSNKYSGIL